MAVVISDGSLVSLQRPWTPNPVAGSVSYYSGQTEDYATIYRTQPNVRLCVRFLGRNIAQLNLKAYRRLSDVERVQLERGHPLPSTIRQPNPRTTRHRFIRAIVEDRAIFDNAFILKARNPASGALRLFRLPPQQMRPGDDNWLYPDSWLFVGNRERKSFPADTVIHLTGHNPADTRMGVSPIESIRRLLAEDAAAGDWREQYWKGAARTSGVLKRPVEAPKWSPDARSRFRADWDATYSGLGSGAGKTPVLEEGMDFVKTAFSAEDSEYLGARKLSREEAAAQFFIPPVFVGILEHANFANVKEQHKSLYQDTLGPWLDELEEDFELQLLPEFPDVEDVYLQFNIEEKLRGSFEEEVTSLQTAVGAPWMSRNEARARRNMPPIDGGDQLVTPLNVLVGGQASPRDTAPPSSGQASRRKSADDLPQPVRGWAAKHVEVLSDFFGRQEQTIRARLGAGVSVDDAWNDDRWNGELTDALAGLAVELTGEVATDVAEQFGATYDPARAEAWLQENSRVVAEEINAATKGQIAEVWNGRSGQSARSKADGEDDDEEEDPLDLVTGVFALAAGARAEQIAVTRVTQIGNFARQEGATQAGAGQKVWVVNSGNSRHPQLDGETVHIGETFSNGARWPGDSLLPDGQRAGCTCSMTFEQ